MSNGVIVLLFVLLGFGVVLGAQSWASRHTRAMRGERAPPLGGAEAAPTAALLFFHSPTCGPCKAMAPHVDRIAAADSRVRSVNVAQQLDVARAYKVMATPTLVAVRDGVVVDIRTGVQSAASLQAMLENLTL